MSPSTGWRSWPPLKQGIEIMEALVGPRPARRRHRAIMREIRDFVSREPFIHDCGDIQSDPQEEPIFIFSAGWRAGSTMLQRMLMGSGRVLIWGEPYDHSDILGTLKRQWLSFTGEWPPRNFFFDGEMEGAADRWVANLYPAVKDMHAAHRAYFVRLFAEPARRHGCDRWGIKEVRWSVDDARYLQWLFPRARFLFLIRNPHHAWRSYRTSRSWYLRWPQEPIFTPYRFGRYWAEMARDYLDHSELVDGRFLRYEDLLATEDFSELSAYLGVEVLSPNAIRKIRSRQPESGPRAVPALERWLLDLGCGKVARRVGYRS
ncbi:MAG: sulfotransferase [Candidatus Krumholzibacteriia bacterium]